MISGRPADLVSRMVGDFAFGFTCLGNPNHRSELPEKELPGCREHLNH
jgi:hypothetical protein